MVGVLQIPVELICNINITVMGGMFVWEDRVETDLCRDSGLFKLKI